jgi:hypothetical protein
MLVMVVVVVVCCWLVNKTPPPGSHLQARGVGGWALAGVSWAEGVVVLNNIKIKIKKHLYFKKHLRVAQTTRLALFGACILTHLNI